MKIQYTSALALGLVTLFSCGGETTPEKTLNEGLCECAELSQKVYEEFEASGGNPDNIAGLQDKYETEFAQCDSISQLVELEFQTLNEEEILNKQNEIREACPLIDEQIKEQERMQQEMMQQQGGGIPFEGELGDSLSEEQIEEILKQLEESQQEVDIHNH